MKKSFLKPVLYIPIGVVLIVIVLMIARGGKTDFESVIVERGDVLEYVDVTGRVKPASNASLAFEQSGKINAINARVGDKVSKGSVLIELFNDDIKARLAQAEATVRTEESKYYELLSGTRTEELTLQQSKVLSSQIAFEDSLQDMLDELRSVYTQADDAIRNKADQFFSNPQSGAPQITIATYGGTDLNARRSRINEIFFDWNKLLGGLSADSYDNKYVEESLSNLNYIKSFLSDLSIQVNRSGTETQKTTLFTARTNIDTSISGLLSAKESLNTAQNNLNVEQDQLDLKIAGTRDDQINAQKATLDRARAQVNEIFALVQKTRIIAPFSGIVTKIDADLGEVVSAQTEVARIMTDGSFEIETEIPEADIEKVSTGDRATVTLDAYRDDVAFEAEVILIEPAETIIDGVPTYRATLRFTQEDTRILSGMTANITINTDEALNVIYAPIRSVETRKDGTYITISEKGKPVEIPITTGLRGSDGNIEVTSGLNEGDEVITYINE